MLGSRAADGCHVKFTPRKDDVSNVPTIQIDSRVGVQILSMDSDTPACPCPGNGNLPLIPGHCNAAQVPSLPARMVINSLAVFLHIIGDSRPAPRDLEVAPPVGGHGVRLLIGWLPVPKTIDAYPLASER